MHGNHNSFDHNKHILFRGLKSLLALQHQPSPDPLEDTPDSSWPEGPHRERERERERERRETTGYEPSSARYSTKTLPTLRRKTPLSSDDVFPRNLPDRGVEPEQWLQRRPEAGSSLPSWPKASLRRRSRPSGGRHTRHSLMPLPNEECIVAIMVRS